MRTKSISRHFRLSKEENELLKKKADQCGLTDAAFIRMAIHSLVPKEKPDEEFYTAIRQLTGISINLNQLTAKANSLGFIDVPLLHKLADDISKLQSELFSKYLFPDEE